MANDEKELSLSEMRMLVSSAVHMDVTQIALCVITIPKLKAAIQDLLGASSLIGLSHSQSKSSRSRSISTAHNGVSMSNGSIGTASVTISDEELDTSIKPEPDQVNSKEDTRRFDPEAEASTPIRSTLVDTVMGESATPGTEFTLIGDKIAIGRPGKSKAKTDKRVRYITCRVCHLCFYKRDQYRDHMLTHANDPNINIYSCDQCMFVTKRRGVFQTHVLRHTGALPFKCSLCEYAGRQSSLLRAHMLNKHAGFGVSGDPTVHDSKCEVTVREISDGDALGDQPEIEYMAVTDGS